MIISLQQNKRRSRQPASRRAGWQVAGSTLATAAQHSPLQAVSRAGVASLSTYAATAARSSSVAIALAKSVPEQAGTGSGRVCAVATGPVTPSTCSRALLPSPLPRLQAMSDDEAAAAKPKPKQSAFPPGTLVWAKFSRYPWWPSKVGACCEQPLWQSLCCSSAGAGPGRVCPAAIPTCGSPCVALCLVCARAGSRAWAADGAPCPAPHAHPPVAALQCRWSFTRSGARQDVPGAMTALHARGGCSPGPFLRFLSACAPVGGVARRRGSALSLLQALAPAASLTHPASCCTTAGRRAVWRASQQGYKDQALLGVFLRRQHLVGARQPASPPRFPTRTPRTVPTFLITSPPSPFEHKPRAATHAART